MTKAHHAEARPRQSHEAAGIIPVQYDLAFGPRGREQSVVLGPLGGIDIGG